MRIYRSHVILICVLVLLLVSVLLYLFGFPSYRRDSLKPLVNSDSMVQGLTNNPLPAPDYVESIQPPAGSAIPYGQEICITVRTGLMGSADSPNDARILVNGEELFEAEFTISAVSIVEMLQDGTLTNRAAICILPKLEIGTHLIEIEPNESGDPPKYAWTYIVE